MKKAIVMVLDGVGAGELPDAGEYGDRGSDTLGNVASAVGGLNLPGLQAMGLGNLHRIKGVEPVPSPIASWGRMAEASRGKDSTTGHWEMMGIVSTSPMPTFPGGFPPGIIERFQELTG
ncbi:MAG TPA: phosphopentomutase, partial [Candidatus Sabulitectum sp.]|nr:phosphopentomutase [Candidatus Sabulitectum sp.]